jgi:acyl-CoA synthetase (AMP-forming)/AMP-acid ligase II
LRSASPKWDFAPAVFAFVGLAEHVLVATFPVRDRQPRVDYISADQLSEERRAVVEPPGEFSVALVSCGTALPGHEIRIVGEHGEPVGEREVGEIALAGPSVMLGYYRDAESTEQTIRRRWLHTGDLGYIADGELFVCGRTKDLIIVNGRKYHPQDLEWAVADIVGVRRGRIVAFGAPGPKDALGLPTFPAATNARPIWWRAPFAGVSATRLACTFTKSFQHQAAPSAGRRAARCSAQAPRRSMNNEDLRLSRAV